MVRVEYIMGGNVVATRQLAVDEDVDLHAIGAIPAKVTLDKQRGTVNAQCTLAQNVPVVLDLLTMRPTVDFDWLSHMYVASTPEHVQRQLAFTGCPWIGSYIARASDTPQNVASAARLKPVDDAANVQRVMSAVSPATEHAELRSHRAVLDGDATTSLPLVSDGDGGDSATIFPLVLDGDGGDAATSLPLVSDGDGGDSATSFPLVLDGDAVTSLPGLDDLALGSYRLDTDAESGQSMRMG